MRSPLTLFASNHKQQNARERLRSEEGYILSFRLLIEPESVFGQIKNNRGFRRFLLCGLQKVKSEGRMALPCPIC
ncbi:transposase [Paenibacillus sp. FSL K6-0108]|uniref:transposase n=1 Tax=Paenibacillus sp. FSL K6-0108 TaxID=2921417 RepID=UPI00324DD25F